MITILIILAGVIALLATRKEEIEIGLVLFFVCILLATFVATIEITVFASTFCNMYNQ